MTVKQLKEILSIYEDDVEISNEHNKRLKMTTYGKIYFSIIGLYLITLLTLILSNKFPYSMEINAFLSVFITGVIVGIVWFLYWFISRILSIFKK